MQTVAVPRPWLDVTQNWSASSLIRLKTAVVRAGVDVNDLEAVRRVAQGMDEVTLTRVRALHARLKVLDAERKTISDELKTLEPVLPTPGWWRIKKGKE